MLQLEAEVVAHGKCLDDPSRGAGGIRNVVDQLDVVGLLGTMLSNVPICSSQPSAVAQRDLRGVLHLFEIEVAGQRRQMGMENVEGKFTSRRQVAMHASQKTQLLVDAHQVLERPERHG